MDPLVVAAVALVAVIAAPHPADDGLDALGERAAKSHPRASYARARCIPRTEY